MAFPGLERTQQLRVWIALTEDLGFGPSTHVGLLTTDREIQPLAFGAFSLTNIHFITQTYT